MYNPRKLRNAPEPPEPPPDPDHPTFKQTIEVHETGESDGLGSEVDPDRLGGPATGHPVSRMQVIAFDDYMKSPTGMNLVTNSNPILDDILGHLDQLAIHVVTGDPLVGGTAPLTLDVRIQHSADGVNWINKQTNPEVPTTTILTGAGGTQKTTLLLPGYDDGTLPSLAFVRLRLNLKTSGAGAAAPVSAKIKIHVTCNDRNEKTFISAEKAKWRQQVRQAQQRAEARRKAAVDAAFAKGEDTLHRAAVRACAEQWVALQSQVWNRNATYQETQAAERKQAAFEAKCARDGVGLDELMAEVRRIAPGHHHTRVATSHRGKS